MKFEEVLHGAERYAPQDFFLWVGEDKALNFFIFFSSFWILKIVWE